MYCSNKQLEVSLGHKIDHKFLLIVLLGTNLK